MLILTEPQSCYSGESLDPDSQALLRTIKSLSHEILFWSKDKDFSVVERLNQDGLLHFQASPLLLYGGPVTLKPLERWYWLWERLFPDLTQDPNCSLVVPEIEYQEPLARYTGCGVFPTLEALVRTL